MRLWAAWVGGYDGIVELLVDKGVDVNAQGGFYSNVLEVVPAQADFANDRAMSARYGGFSIGGLMRSS
jgi:hypothetical protein